jgi:hypothetical protein
VSVYDPYVKKSNLYDPDAAIQIIKSESVEASARGADRDWLLTALRGVRILARRNEYLTSDDVWRWLGPLKLTTPDNRAMGAVMRAAKDEEVISSCQEWRVSERSCCHGRPVRIWKSLRYEGDR